jgi:hypothetical protein
MLVALLTLATLAVPATAPGAVAQDDPTPTTVATAYDDEVTELPRTGRGPGDERAEQGNLAVEQMLITVMVLLGAAVFALGGVAILWGHERR